MLSLSLPGVAKDALAGSGTCTRCYTCSIHIITYAGNHTFAAAKTSEDYENLQGSFKPVLDELNALLESKKITVRGNVVNLDFVFGSDLKVHNYYVHATDFYVYSHPPFPTPLVHADSLGIECS